MNLIYKVESNISINDILTKELNVSTRLKNKLIKNKHVLLNNVFVHKIPNPQLEHHLNIFLLALIHKYLQVQQPS